MKKAVVAISLILMLIFLISCQNKSVYNGKLDGVFKLNGEFKCKGHDEAGNSVEMTIKGTKFRAEAKLLDGRIINSVGDTTNCMHGWYKNQNAGEKVCITKEELDKGVSILEKSKDAGILVECEKFKVEDNFEVPEGINFVQAA